MAYVGQLKLLLQPQQGLFYVCSISSKADLLIEGYLKSYKCESTLPKDFKKSKKIFFLMGLVPSRDVDSKTKIIRSENISKNSSIAIL